MVDCYIDLVDEKAYKFDPKANKLNEIAIPAAAADRIEEMKMALNEAVAETDDALMEKFFMEEPFTKEEIQKGIAAGVKSGTPTLPSPPLYSRPLPTPSLVSCLS